MARLASTGASHTKQTRKSLRARHTLIKYPPMASAIRKLGEAAITFNRGGASNQEYGSGAACLDARGGARSSTRAEGNSPRPTLEGRVVLDARRGELASSHFDAAEIAHARP